MHDEIDSTTATQRWQFSDERTSFLNINDYTIKIDNRCALSVAKQWHVYA